MARCHTCQQNDAVEKIRVVVVAMDGAALEPHEPFNFCSIFCRNVFINHNKAHLKFSREYGDTTAMVSKGGAP